MKDFSTTPGMIDAYCERTADGLWAEPFNLITSIAFIVAAALLFKRSRVSGKIFSSESWDFWLLLICLTAVGIGSLLWHSFAREWAHQADLIPITLLINVFLLSFFVRIAGLPLWQLLGLFIGFQALNIWIIAPFPADFLNGSIFYIPVVITLWGVVLWLFWQQHPLKHAYFLASILFTLSVILRSLDQVSCEVFPLGTHFIWHLINAVVLYLLLRPLARHIRSSS
ncbi:MAG TPA: hypothetical protein ENJ84_08980 [Gammaproteobacteria bacterium]|nr:hypothetical protein [Gammaproteobacteria bacterium]